MIPSKYKLSNNKAIITGKYREFYSFKNAYLYAFKKPQQPFIPKHIRNAKKEKTKEERELYIKTASNRAKSKIMRLINGNQYVYPEIPTFLTLTFAENITDIKFANRRFTNFIKRMTRRIDKQLRYVAVHEFQRRGALHYHAIVFNLPYITKSELEKIWSYGYVHIELVKNDGLPYYMTKYISKSFADPRCKGAKRYFYSIEKDNRSIVIRDNLRCLFELRRMKPEDIINEPTSYTYTDYRGHQNSVLKSEYRVGGGNPVAKQGESPP